MTPVRIAKILKAIAAKIDRSDQPDCDHVIADLCVVLASLDSDEFDVEDALGLEYASIEAFVEHTKGNYLDTFTRKDLQSLNYRLRKPIPWVKAELEKHELMLERPQGMRSWKSLEEFVGKAYAQGKDSFTAQELRFLVRATGYPEDAVLNELNGFGLTLELEPMAEMA